MALGNSVGSFGGSFADALQGAYSMKQRSRQLDLDEQELAARKADAANSKTLTSRSIDDAALAGTAAGATGGASSSSALVVADPDNTDLPDYARAFLNGISNGESGGAYNVRYSPTGSQTFDESTGQHPRIFENGPSGKSSAAGRYQFTASTWDDVAGKDTPFTRYNQDKYAWQLAQDRYKAATGRDLNSELANGNVSEDTFKALSSTWSALGKNQGAYLKTYNDSLSRYRQPVKDAGTPTSSSPDVRDALTSGQTDATKRISFADAGVSATTTSRSIDEAATNPADWIIGKIKG